MAGQIGDQDEVVSAINVTPFVDVVLVLLVILMVSSNDLVRSSIKVDLPKAAAAGESIDTTINVVVLADGNLYLDGVETSKDQIETAIKDAKLKDPKLRVLISADQDVVYSAVVGVISMVRELGVTDFALDVQRI